jgi:hypothetical protein
MAHLESHMKFFHPKKVGGDLSPSLSAEHKLTFG